ncbi:cytoplasmic protein [Lobosporangium transversale]|uniref:Obg-like ATPase 1 n=1 Tax=Lobosporangium transversale TaxID=64571 RepID=A0A1Y2GQH0_9FUNG|nr:cytoplasmic protein [Lobosporangium transversale]ORZ16834.1 cytoplasmic protein [Lobosporangium transversale]|eukprot:XP_021881769.1 cytoplasmic protein [Lobosporangium transversale]
MGQRLLFFTTSTHLYYAKLASKKGSSPVEEKALLGRPSNNLKIGILGVPNIGKSTFFNALTNSAVPAENFPFCTIDPSEARVVVPDKRFAWLVSHFKPQKETPAYLTVIDIAGLVRGAAQGEGLGNAFLNHVRSVDALFHLCRGFEDPGVTHVDGSVDPVRDLETIHDELLLKDIDWLEKVLQEYRPAATRLGPSGTAGSVVERKKRDDFFVIEKLLDWVANQGKDIRTGDWTNKEIEVINQLYLLTAKPMIYLVNISEHDYLNLHKGSHQSIQRVREWVDQHHPGDLVIPFSGSFENQLSLFNDSPQDKQTVLDDASAQAGATIVSALPEIIVRGREALNLQQFFTAGSDEVRAWTIRKNTLAPQAAGVIHSDFERGFIMAEVMKMEDLEELGSEAAVRGAGKYYSKGKDYVIEDGDVIYFKFNVTSKKK